MRTINILDSFNRMPRQRKVLVICAAGALLIALITWGGGPADQTKPNGAQTQAVVNPNRIRTPGSVPPVSTVSQPTRDPFNIPPEYLGGPVPKAAPAQYSRIGQWSGQSIKPPVDRVALTGIITTGGTYYATITVSGQTTICRINDSISNMTVIDIGESYVTLSGPAGRQVLTLPKSL